MAKKIVFGSDFMIYGAPFYKWCRFTKGAVTYVPIINVPHERARCPILLLLCFTRPDRTCIPLKVKEILPKTNQFYRIKCTQK